MKSLFTLCIAIFLLFTFTPNAPAQDSLTLTNGEWPPYFSESFKYGGVGSLICTEAFALEGIDINYEYLPWKRGLEMTRNGKYIGTVGWRKDPERDEDFLYSDPIFTVNSVFFHRQGSHFDWKTLDDIGHMKIGVTLGYTYINLLRPAVSRKGGKLDMATSDILSLQKLAAGRIDLFPCAEAVGYYLLRTKFLPGVADQITHHPKPILEGQIHLLISKKAANGQELIDKFNQGLKKLRESGKYEQYITQSLMGEYLPER